MTIRKYPIQLILVLLLAVAGIGHSQIRMPEKIKNPFPNKKGACFSLRSPGKDKKGNAIKGDFLSNMPKVEKLKVGWNYCWSTDLRSSQPKSVSFAPMVYSVYGNPPVKDITARLKKSLAVSKQQKKHTILLGYNEPDKKNQANLSVEDALKYWKSLEAQNLPLCSPSCVHPDNKWMTDFMKGVKEKGLRVDYIGVHNYGNGNVDALKKKLRKAYLAYGKRPLIVTEFAVADWSASSTQGNRHSPEKILKFMQQILPWMDQQEWILGYSWFSFDINSKVGTSSALFDQKGNLTKLGEFIRIINRILNRAC